MSRTLRWTMYAVLCAMAGCAGNGEGLDQNGRPVGSDESELTPDLQSIQDHVFTPICTQCHAGAAAPRGLRLDADSSYAMLVNAPSSEVPSVNRVTPGNPDASYLVQKIEGRAAVGAQMPLGQPPLPQATIAAIRQWIANGAPQATALQVDVMPVQIRAVEPLPGQKLNPARELLLQAGGTLDMATLTTSSVSLMRSGGDGTFGDGNEIDLGAVHVEARTLEPTVIALKLDSSVLVPDTYRLTLSGHGAQPVRDTAGLAVGDFVQEFSVGDAQ
jgi:hypothetical protein